jgi:hypothetical protein
MCVCIYVVGLYIDMEKYVQQVTYSAYVRAHAQTLLTYHLRLM